MKILNALFCTVLPCAAFAAGEVYRVVPNEESKSVNGWADASTDLKATIEAVKTKDATVELMNGRYVVADTLCITNANAVGLTIRSVNPQTGETDDPAQGEAGAILDAEGQCRIVSCTRATTFQGLTFANGCSVTNSNRTAGYCDGGAVHWGGGPTCFYDCVFTNNSTAGDGGAIGTNWGGQLSGTISNCVFVGNSASGNQRGAGAIHAFNVGGSLNILDCSFIDNSIVSNKTAANAALASSAVHLGQVNGPIVVRGCSFVGNMTQNKAKNLVILTLAGTKVKDTSAPVLEDCRFERNVGCPVGNNYPNSSAANCVFTGNEADHFVSTSQEMTFSNCAFTNNVAGSVLNTTGARGHFRNCLFAGNTLGKLIYQHTNYINRPTRLENCTFSGNTFSAWILDEYLDKTRTDVTGDMIGLAMTNTVFYGNKVAKTPPVNQQCAYRLDRVYTDNAALKAKAAAYGGTVVTDDPRFVDAAAGDYRLTRKSPCREAGALFDWMADATDLSGNPRVLDRDGRVSDNALPDIGCYECAERLPGCLFLIR